MNIVVVTQPRRSLPQGTKIAPLKSEALAATSVAYSWEPYCDAAIETALRLKDRYLDATVIVLGIGPEEHEAWRLLFALGVDRVIHLVASRLDEADCIQIADILAATLKEIGFDIVLVTAPDGEPPAPHVVDHLLSKLKLPQLNDGHTVLRSSSTSVIETVEATRAAGTSSRLPYAIVVRTGSVSRRYCTLNNIRNAKTKSVEVVPCEAADQERKQPSCQLGGCGPSSEKPAIEGSLRSLVGSRRIWPESMETNYVPLSDEEPIAEQLKARGFELDQRLYKTLRRCAECARYVDDMKASNSPQSDDDPLWGSWDWNLDPMGVSLGPIVVNPKMKGICDINIAAYLLAQESTILDALAYPAKSPYHRDLIGERIRETGRFLHNLDYDAGDALEAMCCAPSTTRVFSRAWLQARARNDHTVTWLDFIDATLELSSVLHDEPAARPIFADYLVEVLTDRFVKESMTKDEIVAFLTQSRSRLPRFDGDFQYVLELENDAPQLKISSYIGDFLQRLPDRRCVACRGLLLHQDDYWDFSVDALAELNDLLADVKTPESLFQSFFERHDFFFRKFDCREVYPLVHLTTNKGRELIPDFILTNRDLQRAFIIDLKRPTVKLINHEDNRVRFSQAVMTARAQLLTYRSWFEESANRQRLVSQLGMEIYQPRLAVVIGRTSDFLTSVERQRMAHDTPDVDVVTYDDMLVFAEQQAAFMRDLWRRRPPSGGYVRI